MGGRLARDERQDGHARDDGQHRADLPAPDRLAEVPCADDEQRDEPAGERRLDDRQGREQQRERLQRPACNVEPGTRQPARAPREPCQQTDARARLGRHLTRLQRLERDAQVVEQRGRSTGQRTEQDRRHGPHAR